MNVNKAIIIGRLTRDPELRTTQSGRQVVSLSVATSFVYKDQSGQKQERTEYHNIVSWGRQAEIIAQYFTKGQEIYVEGRLETRSWDDKDSGKKMYRTEIVMEKFEFGAKPQGVSASETNNINQAKSLDKKNDQSSQQEEEEIPTINLDDEEQEEVKIEDVPF